MDRSSSMGGGALKTITEGAGAFRPLKATDQFEWPLGPDPHQSRFILHGSPTTVGD